MDEMGFGPRLPVEGMQSVAHLFSKSQRRGIYALAFSNDEWYAGQSVEFVRRFNDHRKVHGDIVSLRFLKVDHDDLGPVEEKCIRELERAGMRLRNVSLASSVIDCSDFNLLVSPEEEAYWLQGDIQPLCIEERATSPQLRSRKSNDLCYFLNQPKANEMLDLLAYAIAKTVPFPGRTEAAFWSLSCVPGRSTYAVRTWSRLSLGAQEVLALTEHENCEPNAHYLVSESAYIRALTSMVHMKLPRDVAAYDSPYKAGGPDQVWLETYSLESSGLFQQCSPFQAAARAFNLRLVKKQATLFKSSHNYVLADLVFERMRSESQTVKKPVATALAGETNS